MQYHFIIYFAKILNTFPSVCVLFHDTVYTGAFRRGVENKHDSLDQWLGSSWISQSIATTFRYCIRILACHTTITWNQFFRVFNLRSFLTIFSIFSPQNLDGPEGEVVATQHWVSLKKSDIIYVIILHVIRLTRKLSSCSHLFDI